MHWLICRKGTNITIELVIYSLTMRTCCQRGPFYWTPEAGQEFIEKAEQLLGTVMEFSL